VALERFVVARGRVLPEAWEAALLELARRGVEVWTEYGEPSLDAPALIVVDEPLGEPRVHLKGVVAGSLAGLAEYAREVVEGDDEKVGAYGYTYHERLARYSLPSGVVVDQLSYVVRKLREAGWTRRAVAVAFKPWVDGGSEHPPCLVYIWFRVVGGRLEAHAHMRSNDALKACFMNMYAFTSLQARIAREVGVEPGRYAHVADSFHVYQRDYPWFRAFVRQIESGESRRLWRTTAEYERMAGIRRERAADAGAGCAQRAGG
jgi:thymidylate synthase